MTDYVLGQPEPPRSRLGARFGVFGLIIVLVVGLLTTRLFYLQVVQGGYYAGLAEENRSATRWSAVCRRCSISTSRTSSRPSTATPPSVSSWCASRPTFPATWRASSS